MDLFKCQKTDFDFKSIMTEQSPLWNDKEITIGARNRLNTTEGLHLHDN